MSIDPMDLAHDVATAMSGTWTPQAHPHRAEDSALIVDHEGVTIWLEIMGQGVAHAHVGERGKVKLRAYPREDLRGHYGYSDDRPQTMVTAARGPEAIATAALRKIAPAAKQLDRAAQERRRQHEADVVKVQQTTARLHDALGDARTGTPGHGTGRADREQFRAYLGSTLDGGIVNVDVTPSNLELTLQYLTPDQAERVLSALVAEPATV